MQKLITWVVSILVLLGVGIAGFLVYAGKRDFFYSDIEKLVAVETGYSIEKSGPSEFSLFPGPSLAYNNVMVSNPAEPRHPGLGQVGSLKFKLSWRALFRGEPVVDVEVVDADVTLHVYEKDQNNWMTEELALITDGLPFELDKIVASNIQVGITDHERGDEVSFFVGQFNADLASGTSLVDVDSSGHIAGMAFRTKGSLEYSHPQQELILDLALETGMQQPDAAPDLPVTGRASGALQFKDGTPEGVIAVNVDHGSLDHFTSLLPEAYRPASTLGVAKGGFELRLDGRIIDVEKVQVSVESDEFELAINGAINDLAGGMKFEIGIDAEVETLSGVPGFSELVPDYLQSGLGELKLYAESTVAGSLEERKVHAENVRISMESNELQLAINGAIRDLIGEMKLELGIDAEVEKLSEVPGFPDLVPENLQLGLGELKLYAESSISGSLEEFSAEIQTLELSQDGTKLALSGLVKEFSPDLHTELRFELVSDDAVELNRLHPDLEGLKLLGPVDVTGILDIRGDRLSLIDVQAIIGESDLNGRIDLDLGAQPPSISADISSAKYLTAMSIIEPREKDAPSGDDTDADEGPDLEENQISAKEIGKQFKAYSESIAIETDWIHDLDLKLRLTANEARIGYYELKNFNLDFTIKDGIVQLNEFASAGSNDPVSVSGSIDANADPPQFEINASFETLDLYALMDLEEELLEGGHLSGKISLASEGGNLGEFLENMNGDGLLTMGPLIIHSSILANISSDILHSVLTGIISKKDETPRSEYKCGVFGLDIDRGMIRANKTITMQAADYNLIGRGKVDLTTGYVDFRVIPKARKGLGLSASTLVGGFQIKGHMATLGYNLNTGGLVTTAVTGMLLTPTVAAGAAVEPVTATVLATGLVARGLFDRLTVSNYSCSKTLKRVERLRSKTLPPDNHHINRRNF